VSLGAPNSATKVFVIVAALLLAFLVIEWRRSALREGVFTVAVAGLANAGVATALGVLVAPVLTYDSWRFLEYGISTFGDPGTVQMVIQEAFGSYPVVLVSIQGLAVSNGMPFAASSLAGISALALSGAFDAISRPLHGSKRALRVLGIVAVVVTVAASSYMTRVQLGLVNSHALVAGYYALGAAAVFASGASLASTSASIERIRAALLGIACAGVALARVEGLLVAALLLTVGISYRGWSRSSLALLSSVAFILPGIWYARLMTAGASTDILSPPRMAVLLAAAAAPLLIALFKKQNHRVLSLNAAVLVLLSAAIFAIGWENASGLGGSVAALGINLANTGLWGATWWVVIPLAILALARLTDDQARGGWLVLTFGFVFLVLILGGARKFPYRIGWGDSGNRMMIHVLPTFFLLLFHSFRRESRFRILAAGSENPAGDSDGNRVRRDISRDHRAGTDNRAGTDSDPGPDDHTRA
jgi:hypothetical protein